ncbi:MAG TPA: cytochrome b/b6 domain-containing protein [Gammaproteobacteria bacterium]|nr:cytochrome b/b6 domain-containing protein [Gammaproteobacteria bacterium]
MRDTRTGYGWISIALHWVTAILILAIWFIGSSIQTDIAAGSDASLRLHTSLALSAYVLLWIRIWWRFRQGHPAAMPAQVGVFYQIGKYTHYAILVAIAVMLISGPLMVWSRGTVIYVWDWFTIPGPFGENMEVYTFLHSLHVWGSRVIIVGTLLHLGGVYKHAAFNQDGTFGKMLVAAQKD